MQNMQKECFCLHCMASIEEAEWYFGLFCEHDVEECRPIAAAPTLHLFSTVGGASEQIELDLECS